jgi:hypothetical protein
MALSKAASVSAYLKELPAERRKVVSAVRDVVVKNLPKGYVERMAFGMIGYEIPIEKYPDTYNGQALCYAGLAAQKNYYSLYLMSGYSDPKRAEWIASEFKKRGKKLDMGKSCLRFRSVDDLPLDLVGEIVAATPPAQFIKEYEKSRVKK